jgi:hypothetical protein
MVSGMQKLSDRLMTGGVGQDVCHSEDAAGCGASKGPERNAVTAADCRDASTWTWYMRYLQ